MAFSVLQENEVIWYSIILVLSLMYVRKSFYTLSHKNYSTEIIMQMLEGLKSFQKGPNLD